MTVVRDAWSRGQELSLHGWVYALEDGLLRDLGVSARTEAELAEAYVRAVAGRPGGVTPPAGERGP